jgi:hypothetical protein
MFSISKTSFLNRGPSKDAKLSIIGTNGKPKVGNMVDNQFTSTSGLSDTPLDGTKINNNQGVQIDLEPMLTGMAPGSESSLYRVYRDMYKVDPICGSAADLMAHLPFSDFTLGGINSQDNRIEQTFNDTLERLNVKTLLPEAALDFLVMGSSTSSILMNASTKSFVDFMVHDPENITQKKLPFYSQDPILTVKFDSTMQKLLTSDSPRIAGLKELFGSEIFAKINTGELELDPLSTIHVARKSGANSVGTSWFHRALPIYLIEKNLYRGTLVESARRQRGIMHITVGDGDQWEPTPADFEYVSELFTNADADPLGAIVTTRLGISIEEIRQGGDFWKVTDIWDSTLAFKLRALSISESFLSGDATIDTSNAGMMVFLEQLKAFRENITRRFFYNKLFPLISLVNGYQVKNGKTVIDPNLLSNHSGSVEKALKAMNDSGKLLIPTVQWAKHLKPEGDSAYVDLLDSLTQKGVPVPLRALAAAGGFNIDKLLFEQEDDLALRDKVGELQTRTKAILAKYAPAVEGEGGESESSASLKADLLARILSDSSIVGGISSTKKRGAPSLLNRFKSDSEHSEITTQSKTGKKKSVYGQKKAQTAANENILKVVKKFKKEGKL